LFQQLKASTETGGGQGGIKFLTNLGGGKKVIRGVLLVHLFGNIEHNVNTTSYKVGYKS